MTQENSHRADLRLHIINAIQEVAPEMDESTLDTDADLRVECDIDSMDLLNVLTALKSSTGVNIPESDYNQITTFNKMLDYLDRNSLR